jgi:hypothetical protein
MSSQPPKGPLSRLLSDRSVRFWSVAAGIATVLTLLITVASQRSIDGPPANTGNKSNATTTTTEPTPRETGTTTEPTETTNLDALVRWQGKVRLTDDGKNLDNIPPSTGDPVFNTVGFDPEDRTLRIHTWSEGAIWSSSVAPTKQDCLNMVATQTLSDDEKDALPARKRFALCLYTFDERIAHIRVTEVGQMYVMAEAVVWE